MQLLVFAHTPPPHHGQSYMVKLMIDGFGGDQRTARAQGRKSPSETRAISESLGHGGWSLGPAIECYHVNARFSEDLEDIGAFRFGKVLLVLRYCLEAIWCRFRHGVDAFYYVPAPGKRAALYRDWIVMLLCRPFFRHFIHHWHGVGLGDWLKSSGTAFERWLTHRLLGRPALGIALAIPSMRDALWFRSHRVEIVANGIPDPCPDFEEAVLPRRRLRRSARVRLLAGESLTERERAEAGGAPEIFRVLFLAHCMREKGLFDTIDAVALANSHLRGIGSALRIHLTVAGLFPHDDEEAEFQQLMAREDLAQMVAYQGFVGGAAKVALLKECDCLCFPTFYHAESFGLVVVEAMAAGMSVVATRWRAIPELLPSDYPGLVPPHAPQEVAATFERLFIDDEAEALRRNFLERFSESSYRQRLREVLLQLSRDDARPAPAHTWR